MTLGLAPRQADLFSSTSAYCDSRVAADSIYGMLHRQCFTIFPDEMLADLFNDVGRRSVPLMIGAVVMVLQRIGGAATGRPGPVCVSSHLGLITPLLRHDRSRRTSLPASGSARPGRTRPGPAKETVSCPRSRHLCGPQSSGHA